MPSLPVWERGSELADAAMDAGTEGSLPVWERGLERHLGRLVDGDAMSLPVWERGLELGREGCNLAHGSRSLCGSVD